MTNEEKRILKERDKTYKLIEDIDKIMLKLDVTDVVDFFGYFGTVSDEEIFEFVERLENYKKELQES